MSTKEEIQEARAQITSFLEEIRKQISIFSAK